jgi:hypothetical protein
MYNTYIMEKLMELRIREAARASREFWKVSENTGRVGIRPKRVAAEPFTLQAPSHPVCCTA